MTEPIPEVPADAGLGPPIDGSAITVSVVIPTHNFGRYIEEAVGSVLSQDVTGLEVIVIDDGSTDDTMERLARIVDSRLQTVRRPHTGVGAARNHGLSLARGRYIAFLDADDRWRPGKLRRQLAILESEAEVGFVFTNFVRFDQRGVQRETQFDWVPEMASLPTRPSRDGAGRVIVGDTFAFLAPLSQLPCWTQTMVVRADLVRGLTFPPDMVLSQDLYYVLNVYRLADGGDIDDPLVEVRRHGSNSYRRVDAKLWPDIDAATRTLQRVTEAPTPACAGAPARSGVDGGWVSLLLDWARPSSVPCHWHALRYPGVRRRAALRLIASPLAALISRVRPREPAPFPGSRS